MSDPAPAPAKSAPETGAGPEADAEAAAPRGPGPDDAPDDALAAPAQPPEAAALSLSAAAPPRGQLVPVEDGALPGPTPPVYAALAFTGPRPAAPLHRAWLRSGGGAAGGAADGPPRRLRAAIWPAQVWEGKPRGTILLFPGRTEYIEKYLRVIARFTAMGFWVATLDWRGQGLSTRSHGPRLGHVDSFDEFQDDVAALLAWAPVQDLPGPRILVAHSMGGAIGLRAMLDGRLSVEGAIFSAPFWGMPVDGAAGFFARGFALGAMALGLAHREVSMSDGPNGTYVLDNDFEGNAFTEDPEHYAWMRRQAEARPELTLGAPSVGFISAAFDELRELRGRPSPDIPMLAFVGSGERVVSADAIRSRMRAAPRGRLARIEGARHEGFMESPARGPGAAIWRAIARFLHDEGF
ncbi:alpha/beta fold hydrolase [Rhodovulum sp. DZ06]|uniref:alpha/beta fold hydrolase n=1 Tax=Rhodovulum sp. DZ06 TaxID=3425126 RepID=UPI003D356938